MEALFELLLEIFIEVFGQIIFEALSGVFANFASYIQANTKAKKILKYSIAVIIFTATLVLLILALCFKKTLYVELVISYFIALLVTYILKFISKNVWKNRKFEKTVTWVNRGIHYTFPVILIIFASIYVNKATPVIIGISIFVLVIYFFIYIYRVFYKASKNAYEDFKRKYSKKAKTYLDTKKRRQYILIFLEENKNNYLKYLQTDAKKEDIVLLDDIFLELSSYYNSKLFLEIVEELANQFVYVNLYDKIEKEKENLKNYL